MKIILFLAILLIIWAIFIEPNILTVKRVQIKDEQLAGTKIVFATDLHYKKYQQWRISRDVKKINAQNPDIILLGGDFVNGHKKMQSLNHSIIAKGLGELRAKHGVFAVLGNHDIWQDGAGMLEKLETYDITVLKNSNIEVNGIYIAGVEDMQTQNPDVEKALEGASSPTILLSHTPDVIEDVPERVNLTLAGHVHGGQVVIPLYGAVVVPSKFGTKFAYGLFDVNGHKMFVSRGIGTSILPIRFFCPPEIVVITFTE